MMAATRRPLGEQTNTSPERHNRPNKVRVGSLPPAFLSINVADMDDAKAPELVFSARFACPVCGYSISELEPRMFSFNNPAGACSECDGLGVKQFFDPELVVADDELTLAEGAIRGWDRRNIYYFV